MFVDCISVKVDKISESEYVIGHSLSVVMNGLGGERSCTAPASMFAFVAVLRSLSAYSPLLI